MQRQQVWVRVWGWGGWKAKEWTDIDNLILTDKKVGCPHRLATLRKRTHRWKEEQWSSCYNAVLCWETLGPCGMCWKNSVPWAPYVTNLQDSNEPPPSPDARNHRRPQEDMCLHQGLHRSELFQLMNWMGGWLVYTDRVVGEWDTVEHVDVRVWWPELMGKSEGIWWTGGEWQWCLIEMHGPGEWQCIWG